MMVTRISSLRSFLALSRNFLFSFSMSRLTALHSRDENHMRCSYNVSVCVWVHFRGCLPVVGVAHVVLLHPDEAARRAIRQPERVERSDDIVVRAARVAKLGYVDFLVVERSILLGQIGEHVAIDGEEALQIVLRNAMRKAHYLENIRRKREVLTFSSSPKPRKQLDVK